MKVGSVFPGVGGRGRGQERSLDAKGTAGSKAQGHVSAWPHGVFREHEYSGIFSTSHEWEETVGYGAYREFQRTLIRCEWEKRALLQKSCKLLLIFQVRPIFPLGPNRISFIHFGKLNELYFFFKMKGSPML